MTKNKKLLDDLKKKLPNIDKLTYIELGILLENLGFHTDWVSLEEAHDYLGKYENDDRDHLTKTVLNIDIFHLTKDQSQAIKDNDLRILNIARGGEK